MIRASGNLVVIYKSYGGISRSVIVEELPSLFIDWVHAEPYLENNVWNLKIRVKINNIDTQKHKAQINASVANSPAICHV